MKVSLLHLYRVHTSNSKYHFSDRANTVLKYQVDQECYGNWLGNHRGILIVRIVEEHAELSLLWWGCINIKQIKDAVEWVYLYYLKDVINLLVP